MITVFITELIRMAPCDTEIVQIVHGGRYQENGSLKCMNMFMS